MKVLCVIVMQNDFIDGSLGTKEAEAIVGNVENKIREYLDNGDTVIFTRDTHEENYLDTQEGKMLPVRHCIRGTKGWELSDKLTAEGSEIIDKPSFGSYELAGKVAALEPESVEIVGLCTDICVVSNALLIKARIPETPIFVDSSCCAGVSPDTHMKALDTMKMCQINVF